MWSHLFLNWPTCWNATLQEDRKIPVNQTSNYDCQFIPEKIVMIHASIKPEFNFLYKLYLGPEHFRDNPFPSYRRFLTPLQQIAFWKHSDKEESAISPFATMFTTFCHRLSIQLWRFSMFWQNAFEVVCYRMYVLAKHIFGFCIFNWKHHVYVKLYWIYIHTFI